jgi:hypothetical protein
MTPIIAEVTTHAYPNIRTTDRKVDAASLEV